MVEWILVSRTVWCDGRVVIGVWFDLVVQFVGAGTDLNRTAVGWSAASLVSDSPLCGSALVLWVVIWLSLVLLLLFGNGWNGLIGLLLKRFDVGVGLGLWVFEFGYVVLCDWDFRLCRFWNSLCNHGRLWKLIVWMKLCWGWLLELAFEDFWLVTMNDWRMRLNLCIADEFFFGCAGLSMNFWPVCALKNWPPHLCVCRLNL